MAAAAAAGAYWLYGAKHSVENRKMAKSWMLKARAEILDGIEKLKEVDKTSYMHMAEKIIKSYAGKAGATSAELARMMQDAKTTWLHMQKAQNTATRSAPKTKLASKKMVRPVRKTASIKK